MEEGIGEMVCAADFGHEFGKFADFLVEVSCDEESDIRGRAGVQSGQEVGDALLSDVGSQVARLLEEALLLEEVG